MHVGFVIVFSSLNVKIYHFPHILPPQTALAHFFHDTGLTRKVGNFHIAYIKFFLDDAFVHNVYSTKLKYEPRTKCKFGCVSWVPWK